MDLPAAYPPRPGLPARLCLPLLAGLLWGCDAAPDLQQQATRNAHLIQALHRHANRANWSALDTLVADVVLYRGQPTGFREVAEPRTRFLARLGAGPGAHDPTPLTIRQLYAAGGYQVIVEATRWPDSLAEGPGVCLIYTIEAGRVTRLHAY